MSGTRITNLRETDRAIAEYWNSGERSIIRIMELLEARGCTAHPVGIELRLHYLQSCGLVSGYTESKKGEWP